jgi:hypothetical protein
VYAKVQMNADREVGVGRSEQSRGRDETDWNGDETSQTATIFSHKFQYLCQVIKLQSFSQE